MYERMLISKKVQKSVLDSDAPNSQEFLGVAVLCAIIFISQKYGVRDSLCTKNHKNPGRFLKIPDTGHEAVHQFPQGLELDNQTHKSLEEWMTPDASDGHGWTFFSLVDLLHFSKVSKWCSL